jgi:hypothetical protein
MAESFVWNSGEAAEVSGQVEGQAKKDQAVGSLSPGGSSVADEGKEGRGGQQDEQSDGSMSWATWPLKESVPRSVAVVLFLAAVVWAVASCFGPQWILPSVFILLLFLAGFFFPTFYRLDSESASVRGLITRKRRSWSDVKRYYLGKKGVHLSLTERPSRLEGARGIYLPFGEHRKEIVAFIEGKLRRER